MITNKKVLQKMQQELEQAISKQDQTAEVREHARAIRLLCDLVLESDAGETMSVQQRQTITHDAHEELELRKMMGETLDSKPKSVTTESKPLIEEDANGDSLFDF